MSDNDIEYEGLSEKDKEALRKLRTRIQVENPSELTISAEINPKMLEKSAWFDKQTKKLAEQLTDLGMATDSTNINPQNFKEKVNELRSLQELKKQIRADADPTSKASSGTLRIEDQGQGDSGVDEWDTTEEMIDDLQKLKSGLGTKAQKKRAKEVLDKMFMKSLTGMKQKADLEGKFVKTYESKDEEGVIERMNREYRERRKKKKDVDHNE